MSRQAGQRPEVLVVGGGIAGLVTAWELATAGCSVRLVEAGPTLGGCIGRHQVGGLVLDSGAEAFATASPAVAGLAAEVGVADRIAVPTAGGAWVRHEAGTAPLPGGGLLGIPPRPWSADVRQVLGRAGWARAGLDRLLPRSVGARSLDLGALVRSRLGSRALRRLVEPVVGGVYSVDPDLLAVAAVHPRLLPALAEAGSLTAAAGLLRAGSARPGSAVAGLVGGLYELVEALRRAVAGAGGQVELGRPALALRPRDGRWAVTVPDEVLVADLVVLAAPAAVTAELLADVRAMPAAGTAATASVTLVVRAPLLTRAPRGTGVLVASAAHGVRAKALTHATAKWAWLAEVAGPDRHVLRLAYGRGEPLPDDGELLAAALPDAADLLGMALIEEQLLDRAVVRWHPPVAGPDSTPEKVRAWRASLPAGLLVTGAAVAGTGLAAVVADARSVARGLLAAML